MGWVDIIKNNPQKLDDVLDEMSTDINRLEQIVDRFSKMGSEAKMEEYDLSNVIENVKIYLERRLPSIGKNVQINNQVEEGLLLNGNSILVSWALENIIKNAIDAIDHDKGKIEIKNIKGNNTIYITISDNGRGIPHKDRKNVFRPGFSSKAKGWGMGLSLVKRIIEDIHAGKIEVKESSKTEGTTIQISIPL
jgi:nitrogen fixation/metabolism regulation signal transduction histidine kinase